ncbi:MAG: hypothetical protein U5K51_14930 [Flavobacteriaceae bacterium]|nr:hypothetical protein [Flavobacteriaceae bacterium]
MDEVILSAPFGKLQSENVMKIESNSIETLQKTGAPTLVESLTSIPGVEQFATGQALANQLSEDFQATGFWYTPREFASKISNGVMNTVWALMAQDLKALR